jgi:hypothetical protein
MEFGRNEWNGKTRDMTTGHAIAATPPVNDVRKGRTRPDSLNGQTVTMFVNKQVTEIYVVIYRGRCRSRMTGEIITIFIEFRTEIHVDLLE